MAVFLQAALAKRRRSKTDWEDYMRNCMPLIMLVLLVSMVWPPLAGHSADPDPAKTERQLAIKTLATVISAEAVYYSSHVKYGTVADLTSEPRDLLPPGFPDTANTGQQFGLALGADGQSYRAVLQSSAGVVYTAYERGLIFAADLDELAQALLEGGVLPGEQVSFDEY